MNKLDRRQFLGTIAKPAAIASVIMANPALMAKAVSRIKSATGDPKTIAKDESYWREIQQGYTADRSMINLNNGGVSPSPTVVQNAMKRHLDFSNTSPAYSMWRILEPQREPVRRRLARAFKCAPEEIALTRNASEGLQICQNGIDLKSGDEVLTTTQDYGRMINTFKQRECRDGIVMKQFKIPVPAENDNEIVRLFEKNITPKTKLILMCHMINLTGQILPVKKVVNMARKYDIPVIVDGAHTFAHFDFNINDLDCDYYATSLHKWLCAPHGTGMLYVRKEKIAALWPLQASNECEKDDILFIKTDNTILMDAGALKCDPTDPQTESGGTWAFNSDETALIMTEGTDVTELEMTTLSSSTLILELTEYDSTFQSEIVMKLTYTH